MKGITARLWQCGGILTVLLLLSLTAHAIEEVIKVEAILSNPSAMHRRPVLLKGTVKEVTRIEGIDSLSNPLCGQGFLLEDETGAIQVDYLICCQVPEEKVVVVTEGDQVLVQATIDAPPTNVVKADRSQFGFHAMATSITKVKR